MMETQQPNAFQNHRALLLNADFRPLGFPNHMLGPEELVQRLLAGSIIPIKMSNVMARSQSQSILLPSVVALKSFSTFLTMQGTPTCNLENTFYREFGRCAYDRKRRLRMNASKPSQQASLDHLLPESLGGELEYENIALAQQKFNSERGHDQRVGNRKRPSKLDRRLEALIYTPTRGNLTANYWIMRGCPDDFQEYIAPLTPRTGAAAEMWQENMRVMSLDRAA